MESQPQNPEFRINPENFHPCNYMTFKMEVHCLQSGHYLRKILQCCQGCCHNVTNFCESII